MENNYEYKETERYPKRLLGLTDLNLVIYREPMSQPSPPKVPSDSWFIETNAYV